MTISYEFLKSNSIQLLIHFKQSNTMCTVFKIIYVIKNCCQQNSLVVFSKYS